MKQIKGLLFDLDGVIVDTAKYHYLAWKQIADELGIPFTEEENERLKGVSRARSFEIILELGNLSMAKEEQEKYCVRKNEIYLSYIQEMDENEILPGVKRFLVDARNKKYKIALGSASKNSQCILEKVRINSLFDEIIDGTKVSKAKPDPEVFLQGAKALQLQSDECIVFEDSAAGIEAAHYAGMKTIGVGTKGLLPQANHHIVNFVQTNIDSIIDAID